jgi:hypothetical protein
MNLGRKQRGLFIWRGAGRYALKDHGAYFTQAAVVEVKQVLHAMAGP